MSQTPIRNPQHREAADRLIESICTAHKVLPSQVLSTDRRRHVVTARTEIMVRLWSEVGLSQPEIGWLLKRDHTTVLHALDKHRYGGRLRPYAA